MLSSSEHAGKLRICQAIGSPSSKFSRCLQSFQLLHPPSNLDRATCDSCSANPRPRFWKGVHNIQSSILLAAAEVASLPLVDCMEVFLNFYQTDQPNAAATLHHCSCTPPQAPIGQVLEFILELDVGVSGRGAV